MKRITHIVHISLATLLLLTTTGISLNKHYCMGRLKSVAVFTHAENCTGGELEDPMPCCEDTHEVLQVQDFTQYMFDFDGHPDFFLISDVLWINIPTPLLFEVPTVLKKDPAPPPDLVVLFENFRV